jgi:DNA repair exonuclease SbcCD nuclease subunit
MKFLHSSDWQMGMKAEGVGRVAERIREERLEAARRVIQVARDAGAEMIVLTGDTFEDNAVDRLLIRKVGEILKAFGGPVYVISGNHDPMVPGSVWEHGVWSEASNLHVLARAVPVELEHCVLFPCPLREKYSTRNPTSWIQASGCEKVAIGLAHGNVEGLPNGEPDFPIPRDAPTRLGLDYLALGHWHSFARYDGPDGGCRMAYSGTHETTKFGERDSGNAILVEIDGRGVSPRLTPIKTGRLEWRTLELRVDQPHCLQAMAGELDQMPRADSTLVRVALSGVLFPEDRQALARVDELLAGRFLFGSLDTTGLSPAPEGEGWIETLPSGPFRDAALKLRGQASQSLDPQQRAIATQALLQLFELQERARQ